MRDTFTTTEADAAAFERRHGDELPDERPSASELAEDAALDRATRARISRPGCKGERTKDGTTINCMLLAHGDDVQHQPDPWSARPANTDGWHSEPPF